jgi:hypothetical protein
VKLGIKEKRQEKGEEEECMERKVHIGNKWWKIMTIYKKERKTTRRRTLLGGEFQREKRRKRSKKLGTGERDGKRKAKDKVENAEKKRPMEWI